VPVCPVDCISLENASGEKTGWDAWSQDEAQRALERYAFHVIRYAQARSEPEAAEGEEPERKKSVIEAALARARSKRP
jgi:electron transport complex protein RnfB